MTTPTAAQIRTAITEIRYELAPSAIDAMGVDSDDACDAWVSALLEVYPNADVIVRRSNVDASSMRADGEIDGEQVCIIKRHFGAPSISCDPDAIEVSASVEASIAADDHRVWERACQIAAGE
jgi:hypothetical protein